MKTGGNSSVRPNVKAASARLGSMNFIRLSNTSLWTMIHKNVHVLLLCLQRWTDFNKSYHCHNSVDELQTKHAISHFKSVATIPCKNWKFNFNCAALCPIGLHTAVADATQLSSWVVSASAVCTGLYNTLFNANVMQSRLFTYWDNTPGGGRVYLQLVFHKVVCIAKSLRYVGYIMIDFVHLRCLVPFLF